MLGEEMLAEIDSTLDKLITNAETLKKVSKKDLLPDELEAFHKTQESLLSHLLYMDTLIETKTKNLKLRNKKSASYKIQEKLLKFEKINDCFFENIEETRKAPALKKKPVVRKKAKSLI